MALSGTLEEVGVLDVVQFVNQAHLSGALVLKGEALEAELFYRKGGLVHARLGSLAGLDVLVEIVDWAKGTFLFHPNTTAPVETINMDLHRAVMYALKARDERKAAQTEPERPPTTIGDRLADWIAPLGFVQQAAIFDATGILVSAANPGKPESDIASLCRVLADFISRYSRSRFRKAILDDEHGTLLISSLQRDRWLVVVAGKGTSLGAMTAGMGKLVTNVGALSADAWNISREVLAEAV